MNIVIRRLGLSPDIKFYLHKPWAWRCSTERCLRFPTREGAMAYLKKLGHSGIGVDVVQI